MKKFYILMLLTYSIQPIHAQKADQNLSNLIAPTAVNVDLLPKKNTINFGSAGQPWKNIYFKGSLYYNSIPVIAIDTNRTNTALGSYALYNVSAGGRKNTATGDHALFTNTSGYSNTANGFKSLYSNNTGIYNTAMGDESLYNNSGSYNTAIGSGTLHENTTGSRNMAAGYSALFENTTGSYNTAIGSETLELNITGSYNTAIGLESLHFNSAGSSNTAIGAGTLKFNQSGYGNTAIGENALYYTTVNNNVAIGIDALELNTTGYSNVALGAEALFNNESSSHLVALGDSALFNCQGGTSNTAIGSKTLWQTTTGSSNTALGILAGSILTTQSNNTIVGAFTGNEFATSNATLIGYDADPNAAGYSNITALGYQAQNTAPNQVRIGNSSVMSIGGHVNWSVFSDGRYKKNIKENVAGLAFINKLHPITYTLDITGMNTNVYHSSKQTEFSEQDKKAVQEKETIVYSGFIAQDVEKAAKQIGYDFSGVDAPKNDKDLYALRYSDFVVPLVKAVQELSKMNDSLKGENNVQQKINADLQAEIDDLKSMMQQMRQSSPCNQLTTQNNQASITISNASLQQNIPNPFNHTTTIGYSLSDKFSLAQIIITDKAGKQLKQININAGKGTITVGASTLASSAYNYSLYADGKLLATKQMVLIK